MKQRGAEEEKNRVKQAITMYYLICVSRLHVCIQVKVKFSLEQAMKAQRGSRDIALLFL
jgi:hypothetical protein